jgi:DNA-directed RNA polymerase specialized sigma24 family protein
MAVALVGDAAEADDIVQAAMATTADRYAHLEDPEAHVVSLVVESSRQTGWVEAPLSARGPVLEALGLVPAEERVALALHEEPALNGDIVASSFDMPAENLRALRARAVVRLQEGDPSADVDAALAADLDAAVAGLPDSRTALHEVREQMFARRRRRVGMIAGIVAAVLAALVVFLFTRGDGDGGEASDTTTIEASDTTAPAATTTTTAATTTTVATTTTAPPTTTGPGRYVVEAGDAWVTIAEKLGVTLEALLAANNATAETLLIPGQELVVPQATQDT